MTRVFVSGTKWLWILNSVVSVGCFIAFIILQGRELVYALYIPLDLFFNIAKTVFFWWYFAVDKVD
jgi:hypothetical protein